MSDYPTPQEQPAKATPERSVLTDIRTIAVVALGVWVASKEWNTVGTDAKTMSATVAIHTTQISNLQTTANSLKLDLVTIQAQQAAQTEILRYIAKGRQGPIPEAAK